MSDGFTDKNRMKDTIDADPVVENPQRRRMDDGPISPKRIKRKIRRMEDDVKPGYTPGKSERANLMSPMPKKKPDDVGRSRPISDQQEPAGKDPEPPEQYVRLRIRVEQGEMTVVGFHKVDGPLLLPERLHSGLNYEVVCGKKRIGLGVVPDVGVIRGFADPEGGPERKGHATVEMPSYEFNARVPGVEFTNRSLSRMRVNVYRIKGEPPAQAVRSAPLPEQFESVRQVAQLKGIRRKELSSTLKEQLKRVLR